MRENMERKSGEYIGRLLLDFGQKRTYQSESSEDNPWLRRSRFEIHLARVCRSGREAEQGKLGLWRAVGLQWHNCGTGSPAR